MTTGVKRSAHRVAWELTNGPIPQGLFACHTCDTPLCVNPSHLFLGTNTDNMKDCWAKGRGWQWHAAGEDHPSAKLTEAQAREILQRYAESPKKYGLQTKLSREYGVNSRTINVLVLGRKWKHLSPGSSDPARPFC